MPAENKISYTITNKNEPKGEKSWQEKRTME